MIKNSKIMWIFVILFGKKEVFVNLSGMIIECKWHDIIVSIYKTHRELNH